METNNNTNGSANNYINEFLQKSLRLVQEMEKHGDYEGAKLILVTSSELTQLFLKIENIQPYKVRCHCGKWLRIADELSCYKATGECLHCDHLRGN